MCDAVSGKGDKPLIKTGYWLTPLVRDCAWCPSRVFNQQLRAWRHKEQHTYTHQQNTSSLYYSCLRRSTLSPIYHFLSVSHQPAAGMGDQINQDEVKEEERTGLELEEKGINKSEM